MTHAIQVAEEVLVSFATRRFASFFDDPNQLATYACIFVVFVDGVRNVCRTEWEHSRALLTAFKIAGILVIGATKSRGALVAILAFEMIARRVSGHSKLSIWMRMSDFMTYGFVFAIFIFAGRLGAVDGARSTDSAAARIPIWEAGVRMIQSAPLLGIGRYVAADAFSDIYQEPEDNRKYTSLLSGVLTIGVENGLLLLFVLLIPVVMSLLAPSSPNAPTVFWGMLCQSEVCVIFLNNVTSYVVDSSMAALFIMAGIYLLVRAFANRAIYRIVGCAAVAALACGLLFACSILLNRKSSAMGSILVADNEYRFFLKPQGPTILLLSMDPAMPIKAIATEASENPTLGTLIIIKRFDHIPHGVDKIVVFGATGPLASVFAGIDIPIALIDPRRIPTRKIPAFSECFLSSRDESHLNAFWERAAGMYGARVTYLTEGNFNDAKFWSSLHLN